jgi:hypothetical protein
VALGSTQPLTEMSTRNISLEGGGGGEGGWCVGLTTLPLSCADCREIWGHQPPATLRGCTGIALPFFNSLQMAVKGRNVQGFTTCLCIHVSNYSVVVGIYVVKCHKKTHDYMSQMVWDTKY